jgi:hypothetical protein
MAEPTQQPHPVRPLAPPARRALAGTMIAGAVPDRGVLVAAVVADVLDAASWAVLGAAGCTPNDARAVLAALWTTQ